MTNTYIVYKNIQFIATFWLTFLNLSWKLSIFAPLIMAQSYLQIDNLTKSFGDLVLFENLSLGISEGDRIGLIARNGSGKTTLLNIIMGIEGKDEGSIVWRND